MSETQEERVFTAFLMQEGMMESVTACLAPIVRRIRAEGYTDGFKAGQEAMRERAAQHSGHMRWDGECMWVRQENIRALPVEEQQ